MEISSGGISRRVDIIVYIYICITTEIIDFIMHVRVFIPQKQHHPNFLSVNSTKNVILCFFFFFFLLTI